MKDKFWKIARPIFSNLFFVFEKFLYADETLYFPTAELEHWNYAMRIPGTLKLYDFPVHEQDDISLFRFDLKKFRCTYERVSLAAAG